MKKFICHLVLIAVAFLWVDPAVALLGEVRATYGETSGKPEDYNKAYFNFQDGPEISKQRYLGVDGILMLPMIPLGVGLRYEKTGEDKTQFAEKIDYAFTRLALVLNYRIVNTLFYLGPIATYGLTHNLEFKIPTRPDEFKAGKSKSYSIGVEGGVKLGLFRLGLEVGQMSMVFDDLKDIGGVTPNKNGLNINKLDFGGTYYKVQAGIGF